MPPPDPAFAGQTAIVTGGASGIGRALASALVARGAHVVVADVDAAGAEAAASEIGAGPDGTPGSAAPAALDVRDADAVLALVQDTVARRGGLDLMFNNAGVSVGGPTHEMEQAHWQRVLDVNLHGVVNGVLAAYPVMVAQGHGHIVNTASGAGLAPAPLVVAYSASKHAVVGLSTALRPEAAALGVRVTVLCPGAVDTPILDSSQPADLPARASATITGREYLRRMGVRPMPARRFAEQALRGVARNRAVVVVPRSTKALWYLHRAAPGVVERVGRLTVRRMAPR